MADKKMCKIVQKIDFENKRETEIFKTEEADFTNLAGGTRLFL